MAPSQNIGLFAFLGVSFVGFTYVVRVVAPYGHRAALRSALGYLI